MFTTRTIVHQYNNADNTAASGKVTFNLMGSMTNDGSTIIPGEVVCGLDGTGSISVTLAANDDPDTVPASVQWQVSLRIIGSDTLTYAITVPSAGSGNVDLGSLLPGAAQVN